MSSENKERVIVYVDGFNLYFGLKDQGWRHLYWLNIRKFGENLIKPTQHLSGVKYFTSRITTQNEKRRRQAVFLEALESTDGIEIFFGKYNANEITCRNCSHVRIQYQEKMTDVNIATRMMIDAFQNRFDAAILVSGDSDLHSPIEAIKNTFPEKRIIVAFPPKRYSRDLAEIAHANFHVGKPMLSRSQFPDSITKADGHILSCPEHWKSGRN